MFSLLKPTISAHEVAEVFIEHIQKDVANGQLNKPFIEQAAPADLPTIRMEWFYLDVFNVDYCVFLAFGTSAEKKATLDSFWSQTRQWLAASPVPALPERMGPYAGQMKIIAAECPELAYDRLKRRCTMYSEEITNPHRLGENHGIGLTFAILCADLSFPFIAGVAAFFHRRKMEWVKMLKSHRIILP